MSLTMPTSDFDTIIIGAGHNGLATGTVLARNGHKVLVLEKNNYVGGMGGSREILKGCINEVGASCLFPLSTEIKDYFQFEANGVELIPLPVMAVNLTGDDGRPLVFYKNPLKLAWGICKTFGPGAMLGFVRFMKFCQYPAQVLDRFTARKAPQNLDDLIAQAPTAAQREQLELAFKGSAMDIINKFFPDPIRHKELRANMAFAAVQATFKGPYTPGSGMCLIFTMAQEGSGGLMQRVKGGMGKLSECLAEQIREAGGEVRTKQFVSRILVEGDRAVGVVLKNGDHLFANCIVSNLDKPATFNRLLIGHSIADEVQSRIDDFEHRGAFVHMLFKLKGLPGFRELIVDKAIFSAEHFASMEGATNGDWTHGLLHPNQMVGDRCIVAGTGHVTPLTNLFLCGSSCHPGPGVTFLPGYNCAYEVLEHCQFGDDERSDVVVGCAA